MKIYKIQSNCGGYKKPKGHLDTQMFPECEGTDSDRDIIRKNRKRKRKTSNNEGNFKNECPFCGNIEQCRCPGKFHDGVDIFKTNDLCQSCKEASIHTAKKKKEYKYNPYAICNTTVDKEKDPEKYERCVKKVKDRQDKKNKQKKESSYNAFEHSNIKFCNCSLNGGNCT